MHEGEEDNQHQDDDGGKKKKKKKRNKKRGANKGEVQETLVSPNAQADAIKQNIDRNSLYADSDQSEDEGI